MIVERLHKEQPSDQSLPTEAGSPGTAMKSATVALGIAVGISLFAAWHYQTQNSLYEAILDHTNIRHHDALGNPWFDKKIDDCSACGVKIKSSDGK